MAQSHYIGRTMSDIERELRSFIAGLARVPESDLDADAQLFGTGIIDSLNLLDLVAFVEKRWSLSVGAGDLTLDNWQSIRTIESYIGRQPGR